jgi:hypothetical protein
VRVNEKDRSSKKRPAPAAKTPDPVWVWAENHARDPHREAELRKAFGEEALARLHLLRQAAANFATTLPGVDEWAAFLAREIIPVYNSIASQDRMCIACGRRFAVRRGAAEATVCSARCRARSDGAADGAGGAAMQRHEPGETEKITLDNLAGLAKAKPRSGKGR